MMTAFGAKQPVWDYEHLYEFLKSPGAYIDGTKMTYQGLKAPQDRINLIAYLHSLGSNLPVPPPTVTGTVCPQTTPTRIPTPAFTPAPGCSPGSRSRSD